MKQLADSVKRRRKAAPTNPGVSQDHSDGDGQDYMELAQSPLGGAYSNSNSLATTLTTMFQKPRTTSWMGKILSVRNESGCCWVISFLLGAFPQRQWVFISSNQSLKI
jgi:hypothetical protein